MAQNETVQNLAHNDAVQKGAIDLAKNDKVFIFYY